MSASADHFKRATLQEAASLSTEQRVLRALALGQSDLEIRAAVTGLSLEEVRAELRRSRDLDRRRAQGRPAP